MAKIEAIKKKLGRRCREVRTLKGLSQMDLVRNHDWSLSHYQRIERGAADPRFSTIVKLAQSLGVSVSELVEGF